MDDEQFLIDMITSGSTAGVHAEEIGDATNTDIYLNMSGGDEIDQTRDAAANQEANVYIITSIFLF
jgi:hypothetical protein